MASTTLYTKFKKNAKALRLFNLPPEKKRQHDTHTKNIRFRLPNRYFMLHSMFVEAFCSAFLCANSAPSPSQHTWRRERERAKEKQRAENNGKNCIIAERCSTWESSTSPTNLDAHFLMVGALLSLQCWISLWATNFISHSICREFDRRAHEVNERKLGVVALNSKVVDDDTYSSASWNRNRFRYWENHIAKFYGKTKSRIA